MSDKESIPSRRTVRGGVEVRVIGGGIGDLRRKDWKASGWIEGESVVDTVDSEEVVRLGGEAPRLANRRLEDEERAAPVPISKKKRSLGLRGLTVLMASVAVLLAVATVSVVVSVGIDPPGRDSGFESMGVVNGEGSAAGVDDRAEALVKESIDLLIKESIDLFVEYTAAERVEDVVGMIRNGEELGPVLRQRWKPMSDVENVKVRAFEFVGGGGALVRGVEVVGGDEIGITFIETEGGLKLDWEASMGIGDVEFDELKSIEIGRSVTMRVLIEASTYYPVEFPDDAFRSYRISSRGGKARAFGYARVDSAVAAQLSENFNENTILLNRFSNRAMIVRLRNDGYGESGQFTIVGVKQTGWIEP